MNIDNITDIEIFFDFFKSMSNEEIGGIFTKRELTTIYSNVYRRKPLSRYRTSEDIVKALRLLYYNIKRGNALVDLAKKN